MEESAVNFLLEKLTAPIIAEALLLSGVGHEVGKIKLELENMQAFLRDADGRRDSNEELKTWVRQVRKVADGIECILDEFVYCIYAPRSRGFKSLIHRTFRLPKNIYYKYRFATRLREINQNVREISERRNRYNLNRIKEGTTSEEWQRNIEANIFKEEDDIVGMKKEFELIVRWLLEGDQRLSVTGMGGLGKTTPVSKAFNHSDVKKFFHCSAYVSVPQTPRITELLQSIVKQLLESRKETAPDQLATIDARDLRQLIVHHLQLKSYVIVLDDVWSVKDWEDISCIFQDHPCRSRLMVTTRNVEVARAVGRGRHICALQPLNQEVAWELFNNKAFRNQPCPSHLKPLARSMVEKCEGLPLAIVAMGGQLLTKEQNLTEWNNVYNSLN